MANSYLTFLLKLPSGGSVVVRKPHPLLHMSSGPLLLPLLSAAIDVTHQDNEPPNQIKPIRGLCRICLVDASLDVDDLPLTDLLYLYSWAVSEDTEPALPSGEWPFVASDCLPLVEGTGAMLVDAICHRYSIKPSDLLGFRDANFAVDLDMAIGYRGICGQNPKHRGQVEVEDIFGNPHWIPAEWQEVERGARLITADMMARETAMSGKSIGGYSAGGAVNCSMGMEFGEFGRFNQ